MLVRWLFRNRQKVQQAHCVPTRGFLFLATESAAYSVHELIDEPNFVIDLQVELGAHFLPRVKRHLRYFPDPLSDQD